MQDRENTIEIKANKPPKGMKCAFFIDKYNNIFCFGDYCKHIAILVDNEISAVYIDENDDVDKKVAISINSTNKCNENLLVFASHFVCRKDIIKQVHTGTIATKNAELANEENLVIETNSSEIYYRGGDNNYGFVFFWTKRNVGKDTWYCRGYATITYQDGTTETIYTDIISAKRE